MGQLPQHHSDEPPHEESALEQKARELESQLAQERKRVRALGRELLRARAGEQQRIEALAQLLADALRDDNHAAHFHNHQIDSAPQGDAARCWLYDLDCPKPPPEESAVNMGKRIGFCTTCQVFESFVPDVNARLGELVNAVLFLLRRKHAQFADAQQQLVQSEKLAGLGELAAGLAHEINNPTGIILSRLDLIELENADSLPGPVRDDLQCVRRHAERLRLITKSLTSFARRHKVERRVVVMQALLSELLEIVERTILHHNVALLTDMPEAPMKVFADATMIQQVFMNIILNARDAMPDGGKLRITGTVKGDELVVTFRDEGVGMDQFVRAHVFDPFFTTKDDRGTGLGLSVSYGIIKDHGGRIEVESEPGEGALFRVVLPQHVVGNEESCL